VVQWAAAAVLFLGPVSNANVKRKAIVVHRAVGSSLLLLVVAAFTTGIMDKQWIEMAFQDKGKFDPMILWGNYGGIGVLFAAIAVYSSVYKQAQGDEGGIQERFLPKRADE